MEIIREIFATRDRDNSLVLWRGDMEPPVRALGYWKHDNPKAFLCSLDKADADFLGLSDMSYGETEPRKVRISIGFE